MKKLPYPRLELRWRKSNKKQDGDMFPYYNWACDYILVLYPKTVSDIRSNKDDTYAFQDVKYVLNTSYRKSVEEPYAGDTPFREGAHAQWDSALLNVPAYSIYNRKVKIIDITDDNRNQVNERLHGTVAQ